MVVRDCDQFLLKRMFTVEENRMFALYFFLLMTVKEMCALHVLFLEVSFFFNS